TADAEVPRAALGGVGTRDAYAVAAGAARALRGTPDTGQQSAEPIEQVLPAPGALQHRLPTVLPKSVQVVPVQHWEEFAHARPDGTACARSLAKSGGLCHAAEPGAARGTTFRRRTLSAPTGRHASSPGCRPG